MKITKSILAVAIAALLLSSCASIDNNFSKRKYDVGHQTASNIENKGTIQKDYELTEETSEPVVYEASVEKYQTLSKNTTTISGTSKVENTASSIATNSASESDILPNNFKSSEAKAKEINKSIFKKKNNSKPHNILGEDMQILEIILAIFIPPLAVFLHEDSITTNFWIDLILCFLFWVPGIVFALLVVLDVI